MSMVFNIARKKKVESDSEDLSKVFYFSSEAPFSVGLYDTSSKTWNNRLEYSFDNQNWTTFEPTTVAECNDQNGGKIYFRGTTNYTLSGNHANDTNDDYAFFKLTGNEIACRGDLTALLNYLLLDDPLALTPLMSDYCLYHLFKNCTALVEASIIIPSFVRGTKCCASMFAGCSNLRNAPTIKIYHISNSCFMNMFDGCTALTEAPALNVVTLNDYCYAAMFKGCSSLVSPPVLPSTTLSYGCYTAMFDGCVSLVNAPALPASNLAYGCYNQMFNGCTSLINAPALPATVAVEACYQAMFRGCTSLRATPKINITKGASSCCSEMFKNCTSLKTVSALLPLVVYEYGYSEMFMNCTALEMLPAISATIYYMNSCSNMFSGCASLQIYTTRDSEHNARFSLPYSLGEYENTCYNDYAFSSMFKNCQTDIVKPSSEVVYYTQSVYVEDQSLIAEDQTNMFEFVRLGGAFTLTVRSICNSVASWDGDLYYKIVSSNQEDDDTDWVIIDKTQETETIQSADTICGRVLVKGVNNHYITTTASNSDNLPVFDISINDSGNYVFCRGNIEVLLDADTVQTGSHPSMTGNGFKALFANNSYLRSAPALLPINLVNSCYAYMFKSNSNLIKVTSLPATSVSKLGYAYMYDACGNLLKGPKIYARELGESSCAYMLNGCTRLESIPDLVFTTAGVQSCEAMFFNCYSLVNAPALPATSVQTGSYSRMFMNCNTLTEAPDLPAITLAAQCYQNMFTGCTSLLRPPALPATTLANKCYYRMFTSCFALIALPALSATYLPQGCYQEMFMNINSYVMISSSASSSKPARWRLPYAASSIGSREDATATNEMFAGSSDVLTPSLNTTYYTSAVVLPDGSLVTS